MTPLQVWTRTLFNLLADARVALDDDAYSWLIAIGCERIGMEAARLAVDEALRAARQSEGQRAA